jgi:hypothetical protein
MACQYWYDNKWRSEEEFKQILDNGLLDSLIQEGKVTIPELEVDSKRAKEFAKEQIKKQPIKLRILRKIQRVINNERTPGDLNYVNNNPIEVLDKANKERKERDSKSQDIAFKMIIKVNGVIKIGKENVENKALLKALEKSEIFANIKDNLEEGIPYMMVPSAYGLYPMRIRSSKVKETTEFNDVKLALANLLKAVESQDILNARRKIEKMLYHTTVERTTTNKILVSKQDNDLGKVVSQLFDTAEEAQNYIGELLYRCDWDKINSGTYNQTLAQIGAVTTDLYSEDGNFFSSSSFVIEAYQMSPEDRANVELIMEAKMPTSKASVEFSNLALSRTMPVNNTKDKKNESPIFSAPINDVTAAVDIANKEVVRDINIPNSNLVARVIASVENGVVTVKSIQKLAITPRKGGNPTVQVLSINNQELQEATKAFFAREDIKKLQTPQSVKKEETPTEAPTEEKKSIIKTATSNFLKSAVDVAASESAANRPDAPPVAEQQSLDSIIASSTEIAPEEPTSVDDFDDFDLGFDIDSTGTERQEDPNGYKINRTMLKPKVDGTKWNQQEALEWLKGTLGKAYKRGSGRKGTVRIFHSLEALENYLPKETYEMLLEARKNGKELHGLFTQAALFLSKNADAGVEFHEAFHIVFNLALPLRSRIRILNEAMEKYPDELPLKKIVDSEGNTTYEYPTYIEIEEVLADKFMEYMQAKEQVDPAEKSKAKEIFKTFKGMNRMIQIFFSRNRQFDIEQIFENIDLGAYKNSIQFRNTVLPTSARMMSKDVNTDRKYSSAEEERQAFVYMQTVMDELFNVIRSKEENQFKGDVQIIKDLGVDKFYTMLVSQIYADTKANIAANTSAALPLKKLVGVLTNNLKDVEEVDIQGSKFLQFKRPTDLLERFNQSLTLRGITMSLNTVEESAVDFKPDEEDFMDAQEENTVENSWMKGYIEMDPKVSMSQKLKSFFATIPKYNANGKPLLNEFNVQEKESPSYIFGYLLSRISDSYSVADMMAKIDGIINDKTFMPHIADQIALDSGLKTDLWLAIGQKNFATFSFVYEKDGDYSVVNSNRQTYDAIIKDTLVANFLVQENTLFGKDKNGARNFENVNPEKAGAISDEIEILKNQAASITTRIEDETFEQAVEILFKIMSEKFAKLYINLTPEDLINVWKPTKGKTRKASWGNITSLINVVSDIAKELELGHNPFLYARPEQLVVDPKVKKNKNNIERLATILQPALEKEVVSVFRSIKGKTTYNLILSNFLNKQLNKFKDPKKFAQYMDEIKGDEYMKNLPFLKDLANPEEDLGSLLEAVVLDGLVRKGKNRSVNYTEMSDIELMVTELGMFYNSGNTRGISRFKLPIPADSPTIPFITARRFDKEEIVDRLLQNAKAEYSRIVKVKNLPANSPLRLVPNYVKRGVQFQSMSFLNKLDFKKGFDEKKVKEAIKEFMEKDYLQLQYQSYLKTGVIKSINPVTGAITFADKLLSNKIKDQAAFFTDYLYNAYYMNTQLTTVFAGDLAFYKNTDNFQKRYKQVMSPGMFTNTEGIPDTFNSVILKDEILPTKAATSKAIVEIIKSSDLTAEEKKKLITLWTAGLTDVKSSEYKGNNTTDGATMISIHRRKAQLEGLNRWTDAHQIAYDKELKGIPLDITEFDLFRPEKPYYFAHRISNGTVVPAQIKNSEVVLTRALAAKFPKLEAVYDTLMNGIKNEDGTTTTVDSAIFESAIKVGGSKSFINGNEDYATYTKQKDGSYKLSSNPEIVVLNAADYRLQQETPEHFIDSEGNFSTQLRNLIIADMDLEGDYIINNQTMKGKDVVKLYQELVVEDLRTSFEDVKEMFLKPDGNIDYQKLAKELRKEVISRNMGQEYLDALAPIEVTLKNGDKDYRTTLPLYHPLISYKMEAVMNSFFKNRVTKQKISGGAVVNASSYGIADNLDFIVDEKTGTITFEAMMPWTSRKYFPLNADGEVDIDTIRETASELLEVIGLRIPNEDKYSTFNIKIVGFTPPEMGGMLILPREITTLAGLDFDIDKTYLMTRSFTVDTKGKPKYTKFQSTLDSESEAKELAKSIFQNFGDFSRFVKTNFEGNNLEKMLNVRRELMDSLPEKLTKEEKSELFDDVKILKDSKKQAILMYGPDSSFVQTIQDEIDTLYKAISNDLPFNETSQEIQKKHQDVIDVIAKKLMSEKFNAVQYNSTAARDNKKIEIIQGILANKNTASAILNPGNFDVLKENAARIRLIQAGKKKEATLTGSELLDAASVLDEGDNFNINYPSTQSELFRRGMTGKELIGIYANHNVHHAKAQYTNMKLKVPIYFNGIPYTELNQIKSPTGTRISKALASNVAAAVDNANDPVASFLNMNTYTANVQSMLQRLGVEERTVFAFLNQPVILELTRNYFNDKGSLSDDKNFRTTMSRWKTLLANKIKEAGVEVEVDTSTDFSNEILERDLLPSGTLEYYQNQLNVLQAFETYHSIASELAMGIQASKSDTKGVGPASANNYTTINKQDRLLRKIEKDTNSIQGLEEAFIESPFSEQIMMPAFTKYGLIEPINILDKIYSAIGKVDSTTGRIKYSALGELKNEFSDQKGEMYSLTEKEASLIDINYINFLASAFPFFKHSQSNEILTKLPDELVRWQKETPINSPYRKLLDSLYVVDSNDYSPIKRIQYYATGKDTLDRQYARQSWERMLQDSDPKVREMALKLVKYTYFSAGYGFGPFTFSNLVPVLFWSDAYQEANNIVDVNGRTFNKFLETALAAGINKNEEIKKRFKRQFMQNHGEKETFTHTVKVDVTTNPLEKGLTPEQENSVLTLAAKESKNGIVKTAKGNLIVNLSKNRQLTPTTNNSQPVEFIKVAKKGKKFTIYQLVKTDFDVKNDFADFDGRTNLTTATYVPLTSLGESNFAIEFDYNRDLNVSSLKENKTETPKSPIQSMQDSFMDQITAAALEPDETKTIPTTVAPVTQNLADIKGVTSTGKVNADYNYNPSNVSEQTREDYKQYVLKQLGKPEIKAKANAFDFIYPDLTITIFKDGSLSYTNVNQKIVDLSKTDAGYDVKFMIGLNKLAEENLNTKPVVSKPNALSSMVDTSLSQRLEIFETIGNKDYDKYAAAGGKMSKENFLSLSPNEQQTAIWQAKNCKE